MRLEVVHAVLEHPTEAAVADLLEAHDTVFWVDWREEDHNIVNDCEDVLKTGALVGEMVDVDTDDGFEVHIVWRGSRHKVPLTYDPADRHVTLVTLNRVLQPEYEVRVCVDSSGGDGLAFLPLSTNGWATLRQRYGKAVDERFRPITERPNLFSDPPEF